MKHAWVACVGLRGEIVLAERSRDRALHPDQIGPYRIRGVLGSGGMGAVYEAVSPGGETVALKVVRGSLSSVDALRRFEREASVRIEHPNVVRVLDAGADDEGQPYLVLERLHGEPLSARLRRDGPMSVSAAVELTLQVARGLQAAHERSVIHRDLKPSNLFCCDDGTVKLLDFGVASLPTEGSSLTRSGQVVGTIYYLSPEQAERTQSVDHRTDIWALGAVLFEALTGRPPFVEETTVGTLIAIMMGEAPDVSTFRADAPTALAAVVRRCLTKDPNARFQSAADAVAALEVIPRTSTPPVLLQPAAIETTSSAAHALTEHAPSDSFIREKAKAARLGWAWLVALFACGAIATASAFFFLTNADQNATELTPIEAVAPVELQTPTTMLPVEQEEVVPAESGGAQSNAADEQSRVEASREIPPPQGDSVAATPSRRRRRSPRRPAAVQEVPPPVVRDERRPPRRSDSIRRDWEPPTSREEGRPTIRGW